MKKFILISVIIGLILAGWLFGQLQKPYPGQDPLAMKTAQVEKGPITLTVSTTGRVVSNLDVEIKCKASGEIVELPHNISDTIQKGDLLLQIDPVDEQRNVRQAEAQLSSSQARLAQSRTNLEIAEKNLTIERRRAEANLKSAKSKAADSDSRSKRAGELFKKKLISQEDYDAEVTVAIQSEASLENAQTEIEDLKVKEVELEIKRQEIKLNEAQAEMDTINLAICQRRLEETRVVAPIDGVVSQRSVQIGQIISSGITNVGGGTAAMTLSDLSHVFILASVDESDIGYVKEHQRAIITVDAYPGIVFEGDVVIIAVKGTNTSNVVTFEVKIEVVSANKTLLKPEMTANVEITAAKKTEALLVPMEAVTLKEGAHYVTRVQADGTTEVRPVEVGITDFVKMEIVSGLDAGDTVVLPDLESVVTTENREQNAGPPPPPM